MTLANIKVSQEETAMKLSNINEGDTVLVDSGFTCMKSGPKLVLKNETGDLYIACEDGHHLIDGQIGTDGNLIGISSEAAQHG